MRVTRRGDIPRERGPGDRFTGEVRLERLLKGGERVGVSVVRFANGARTNWHEHAEEQILYIIEGECRVGNADGVEERLATGDMVVLPGGQRHWHGAAPGSDMAHISITTGADPVWDGPVED